ncbi:hypothetical protein SRHO_G00140530 [Serrasalmus rhombeus]
MSDKVLVLIDPLANESAHERKMLRNWRNFLRMTGHGDQGPKWTGQTMLHNKQHDSSSGGILVLRFAEDDLQGEISALSRHPHKMLTRHDLKWLVHLLQCKDCCAIPGVHKTLRPESTGNNTCER